jgi:4-hydroxybenzoate polyprenyltransferase
MIPEQHERMWARGSRFRSIVAMAHPTGALVFGATVVLLCFVASEGSPPLAPTLYLMGSMVLAQAASGMLNELFDLDIDAIAKPWRGLPMGYITPGQTRLLAALLVLVALAGSALVSTLSAILLFLGVGLSLLYSGLLKRSPLSWLPYVAAYPSVPIWVWISLGRFRPNLLALYPLSLPLVFAMHMVNQLRDFEQDEEEDLRGLVQVLGKNRSSTLCNLLLALGPAPLLLTRINSADQWGFAALVAAALLHWTLLLRVLKKEGVHSAEEFRTLFRSLQISLPAMTVAPRLRV